MLSRSYCLDHYSRDDVQSAMLQLARDREVAGVFYSGAFGTRPNVIQYPNDITSLVDKGVAEFHSSIERWDNPMALRTGNYDSLRKGWDLILDLDCRDFSHAKLAARLLYRALERHGLKSISLKYTGGKGFHLGIPWESIPQELNFRKTVLMFPDLPRHMGLYLKEMMRDDLERGLLKLNSPEELSEISGVPLDQIVTEEGIDPFRVVDIDPVLISSRHLFRMPYSLNKGTGYASLPLSIGELDEFEKHHAHPRGLRVRRLFLRPGEPDEAAGLVAETVDWWSLRKREERKQVKVREPPAEKVPQKYFPPCVKAISAGLSDGRKRALHALLNFLRSSGWGIQEAEEYVTAWNQRNQPPLSDSYLRGQVRWQKARKKAFPPPNCEHQGYYVSIGVCSPDETCGGRAKTVKNPAVYPQRLMKKPDVKDKRVPDKKNPKRKIKGPPEPPTASGF